MSGKRCGCTLNDQQQYEDNQLNYVTRQKEDWKGERGSSYYDKPHAKEHYKRECGRIMRLLVTGSETLPSKAWPVARMFSTRYNIIKISEGARTLRGEQSSRVGTTRAKCGKTRGLVNGHEGGGTVGWDQRESWQTTHNSSSSPPRRPTRCEGGARWGNHRASTGRLQDGTQTPCEVALHPCTTASPVLGPAKASVSGLNSSLFKFVIFPYSNVLQLIPVSRVLRSFSFDWGIVG